MKIYIAGPMRGYPEFNFPAFRDAATRWRNAGFTVVSPAEMDEEIDGFDATSSQAESHEHYMKRDLPAVCGCDGIALLPGWEQSRGANNELAVATICGLKVFDAITMNEMVFNTPRENLLRATEKVVYGARQKDYGPAKENHENIAQMWSVTLGVPVTWQQVIQCMIGVKLARLANSPDHQDSYVDIAGYAAVWDKASHGE